MIRIVGKNGESVETSDIERDRWINESSIFGSEVIQYAEDNYWIERLKTDEDGFTEYIAKSNDVDENNLNCRSAFNVVLNWADAQIDAGKYPLDYHY